MRVLSTSWGTTLVLALMGTSLGCDERSAQEPVEPPVAAQTVEGSEREGDGEAHETEPSGPWDDEVAQVEGRLLAEALNLREYSEWQVVGVPESLGGVRLGDRNPEPVEGVVRDLGLEGRLRTVTDDDGRVTHVVFRPGAGYDELEAYRVTIDAIEEHLGAPTFMGGYQFGRISWRGEGRSLFAEFEDLCCGDWSIRVILHTHDTARICGEEDGFVAWATALVEAATNDDADSAAAMFSYPFKDQMRLTMGSPEEQVLNFAGPEEFVARFSEFRQAFSATPRIVGGRFAALSLSDLEEGTAAYCDPESGYGWVIPGFTAGGYLNVVRRDGGWVAQGISYVP